MGVVLGYIWVFDVRIGEMVWIFYIILKFGEFGYESWLVEVYKWMGGVNFWVGFSLDEEWGIVFVFIGLVFYDFYGGDREGENFFVNFLIVFNVEIGECIWYF